MHESRQTNGTTNKQVCCPSLPLLVEKTMMTKSGILQGIKAATAGVLLLGTAGQAHALADLKMDFNGGSEVTAGAPSVVFGNTLRDVGTAFMLNANWWVDATASSAISASTQSLSLVSIALSNSTAGSVTIRVTQTGLTTTALAVAESLFNASLTLTGIVDTPNASLSYDVYADSTNAEYGTGDLIASLGSIGPNVSAATGHGTAFTNNHAPTDGLYSLTQVITITHTGAGQSAFGAQVTTAPEPAMLGMMGLGAILVLGARRVRNS
jgi:hypothetical protein